MKAKVLSILALLLMAATGAMAQTYTVTMKEGTVEDDKWTIEPAEATTTGVAAGETVTATYSNGTKKVKSVKAVKKAAASNTVDLATLSANYEAQDGETLTGTLAGNYKISIAAGATVTLDGVTIARGLSSSYKWAGITCNGNATITLADGSTNTVKGFYRGHPGIKAGPSGTTLTIQGTGTLNASSNSSDCSGVGIGSNQDSGGSCGNITIKGGTINATGGSDPFGKGSGIGSIGGNSCGNITIANTVTKVTATKGSDATNCIGKGTGSCGVVTIGGTIYWDGSAYQNGGDTYLTTSPFVYEPEP